ncbi:hypothetical protein [Curtobacterium sp. 22159]|uniref:hypothetical protein n=1 Tax=Curtobacterium sp. 22159 TaxID=3453882 RepID=UPI003F85D1F5
MVKAYPYEFHRDVVAVARKRENWPGGCGLRIEGNGSSASPSVKAVEQAELREAQKRIRLLEQEASARPRRGRPVSMRPPRC